MATALVPAVAFAQEATTNDTTYTQKTTEVTAHTTPLLYSTVRSLTSVRKVSVRMSECIRRTVRR